MGAGPSAAAASAAASAAAAASAFASAASAAAWAAAARRAARSAADEAGADDGVLSDMSGAYDRGAGAPDRVRRRDAWSVNSPGDLAGRPHRHRTAATDDVPFRYTPELARQIELRWQDEWADRGTFFAADPVGRPHRR